MLERLYVKREQGEQQQRQRLYYTPKVAVESEEVLAARRFEARSRAKEASYAKLSQDLVSIERGHFDGVAQISADGILNKTQGSRFERRVIKGKPSLIAPPNLLSPLASFLDRPELYEQMVNTLAAEKSGKSRPFSIESIRETTSSESQRHESFARNETIMGTPPRSRAGRKRDQTKLRKNTSLPTIAALSPRSRRRAQQLPAVGIEEMKMLHKLEDNIGFSLDPRKLERECVAAAKAKLPSKTLGSGQMQMQRSISTDSLYSNLLSLSLPHNIKLSDTGRVVPLPENSVLHATLFGNKTSSVQQKIDGPRMNTKQKPSKTRAAKKTTQKHGGGQGGGGGDGAAAAQADPVVAVTAVKAPAVKAGNGFHVDVDSHAQVVHRDLCAQLAKLQWATGDALERGYRNLLALPPGEVWARYLHLQATDADTKAEGRGRGRGQGNGGQGQGQGQGSTDLDLAVDPSSSNPGGAGGALIEKQLVLFEAKPGFELSAHNEALFGETGEELRRLEGAQREYRQSVEARTRREWSQHGDAVIGEAMALHADQEHLAHCKTAAEAQLADTLDAARDALPHSMLLSRKMDAFGQKQGMGSIVRLFSRLIDQVKAVAMHRWVGYIDGFKARDQDHAAGVITRVGRGFLGRLAKRQVEQDNLEQRQLRSTNLGRKKATRQRYALILQAAFRGLKGRQRFQWCWDLREAACSIQRRWRMHSSCITVAGKRGRKKRRVKAATDIQRVFRGHRARRQRKLHEKLKEVEKRKMVQGLKDRRAQEKLTHEGAALRIQQKYRARNRRLATLKRINMRRSEKAIQLQRVIRIRFAQKIAKKKRRQLEKKKQKYERAVILCQRRARCYLSYKKRGELLAAKNYTELKRLEMRDKRLHDTKIPIPFTAAFGGGDGQAIGINVDALKRRKNRLMNKLTVGEKKKHKCAIKIQKVYRGHAARKRLRYYRSHEYEAKRRAANRKRKRAATTIEAGWRGFKGREIYRNKVKTLAAVCIQRHWRGMLGRAWAVEYEQMQNACFAIQARWRGKVLRTRYRRMVSDRRLQDALIAKVQAVARGRYWRHTYYVRLEKARLVSEWEMVCVKRLKVCSMNQMRRMLLAQSRECARWDKKARKRDMKATNKPDLLDLFHAWSSKTAPEELQGAAFNKLVAGCKDVVGHHGLDSNSIDIIFSKIKDKSAKHLSYSQFNTALRAIASQRYPELVAKQEWYPPFTKVSNTDTGGAGGGAGADGAGVDDAGASLQLALGMQAGKGMGKGGGKGKAKAEGGGGETGEHREKGEDGEEEEEEQLHGHYTGEDGAFLKLVLECLYKHKGSKRSYKTLRRSVDGALGFSAAQLQKHHRGLLGRRRFRACVTQRERDRILAEQTGAARAVQQAWRAKAAQRAMHAMLKVTFRKYRDPESKDPYWYNPRTGFLAWEKPRLFGSDDCEFEHVVPTEYTEYAVVCANCEEELADTLDTVVDEAYCTSCYDALHRRGHRAENAHVPVFPCMDCSVQTATCREWLRESRVDRCDCCHISHMRDPRTGRHRVTRIVEPCTECEEYSAKWRCEVADGWCELFCSGCLSKVFNKGHKSRQRPVFLPYYTTTMHAKFERGQRDKARKKRAEEIRAKKEVEYMQKIQKYAIKVQAKWRAKVGRREGKWQLKMGRMQDRRAHKQKKRDDKIRGGLFYKVESALGKPPSLKSDSLEDRITRGLSGKKKAKALAALRKNVGADQPTDPKKHRIEGLRVGTEEELREQVLLGGVRLPATVSVKGGDKLVETSADLTAKNPKGKAWLKRGDRVRIGKYVFFVDADGEFTATTIKLDQKWVEEDAEGVPIYKMDKLGKISSLVTSASRDFKGNREYQAYIKKSAKVQDKLGKSILGLAARAGGPDLVLGRKLGKLGERYQKRAMRNKNRIVTEWKAEKDDMTHEERAAEDTAALDDVAEKKKAASTAAYLGEGTGDKAAEAAKKAQRERMRKLMGRMGEEEEQGQQSTAAEPEVEAAQEQPSEAEGAGGEQGGEESGEADADHDKKKKKKKKKKKDKDMDKE